jgi:hypothetical protein
LFSSRSGFEDGTEMLQMVGMRAQAMHQTLTWRGRSGRLYGMEPVSLETFILNTGELYVVALRELVLWVGSAEDLIGDYQSRSRFRLAMDCADRVFRVDVVTDAVERATVMWDLEGGEPLAELSASAA